jgi:Na+/proline symporter
MQNPTTPRRVMAAVMATAVGFVCMAGSGRVAIRRYLATRDVKAVQRMFDGSLTANFIVQVLLALLGLALLASLRAKPQRVPGEDDLATAADTLFPRFIVSGLPGGLSGLIVAGLFAAAMSGLSSGINSVCSVICGDFLDKFSPRERTQTQRVRRERWVSVAVGLVSIVLRAAVTRVEGHLLELAFKVANLLVASRFGRFVIALFLPRATSFGTLVGAGFGGVTIVTIDSWRELTGRDTAAIGFLGAMAVCLTGQVGVGAWRARCRSARRSVGRRGRISRARRRRRRRCRGPGRRVRGGR